LRVRARFVRSSKACLCLVEDPFNSTDYMARTLGSRWDKLR